MRTGNGAGTAGGTAVAPTEIERALSAAVAGGGADAVVELLARTRLYVLVARLHADIPGWTTPLPAIRDEVSGRTCVPVLTQGMLPPWHPEWVFREVSIGELARIWPYDVQPARGEPRHPVRGDGRRPAQASEGLGAGRRTLRRGPAGRPAHRHAAVRCTGRSPTGWRSAPIWPSPTA